MKTPKETIPEKSGSALVEIILVILLWIMAFCAVSWMILNGGLPLY